MGHNDTLDSKGYVAHLNSVTNLRLNSTLCWCIANLGEAHTILQLNQIGVKFVVDIPLLWISMEPVIISGVL